MLLLLFLPSPLIPLLVLFMSLPFHGAFARIDAAPISYRN